jgi:GH15 family glucan-1,4-alpha-glucosidase
VAEVGGRPVSLRDDMDGLDLGVVGNCGIASLVSRKGRHVWFCFPRLDSDPVFNALVGGDAPERGFMDVALTRESHWSQQYLRNTAILETTGIDANGNSVKITDFAPRHEKFGRSFHPPLLVRRIVPLSGRPRIRVRVRPMFAYGTTMPTMTTGSNHLRYVGPSLALRVTTDMPLAYITQETEFALDRPINLFVGADEPVPEAPETLAQNFFTETEAYWRRWTRGLSIPFEWQEEVIRSAITLKLCSYEDTGAIVAALTTSIPESANSGRNWDYRYCWLRDAYFAVAALNRLGATRTMEGFIRFILDSVLAGNGGGTIAPLFPVSGDGELAEKAAAALPGYKGMGPVRMGNGAATQIQNDVYGSIILTAAQMFWDRRLVSAGDVSLYEQLSEVGQVAVARAFQPDAGPWEYRGRLAPHTYSAAMCWAAAHRLAMIAERLGIMADAQQWNARAQMLRDELLKRATTKDGWISGALDAEIADASTLLLTEIGLLKADDPRVAKTLDVVRDRLMHDGFVFRYHEADDFGRPETAFLVCTFWYCDALALAGRKQEARELFENAITCRNTVGLMSEDVAPKTRVLWGNFPQAYSHVGLIHSAWRLSRGWEEALWRAS